MQKLLIPSLLGLAIFAQQILIGIAIGFVVRIVFAAVDLAGALIGMQMGLSFAIFFDPESLSSRFAVTMLARCDIVGETMHRERCLSLLKNHDGGRTAFVFFRLIHTVHPFTLFTDSQPTTSRAIVTRR